MSVSLLVHWGARTFRPAAMFRRSTCAYRVSVLPMCLLSRILLLHLPLGGVAVDGSARRLSRCSDPGVRREGLLFFSVQSDTIGPESHIVRCNEKSASEGRAEVAKCRKSVSPDLKRIIAMVNLRERLACRVIIRY
jgi:hypothetical protein